MEIIITDWTISIGSIITSGTSSVTDLTLVIRITGVISTIWTWSITRIVIEVMFSFTWWITIVSIRSVTGQARTVTEFTVTGGIIWISSIWASRKTISVMSIVISVTISTTVVITTTAAFTSVITSVTCVTISVGPISAWTSINTSSTI
jgi:hypothetical protein